MVRRNRTKSFIWSETLVEMGLETQINTRVKGPVHPARGRVVSWRQLGLNRWLGKGRAGFRRRDVPTLYKRQG